METAATTVLLSVVLLGAYAYLGYPALLWLMTRRRTWHPPAQAPGTWPHITILLPVYNEERAIGRTLDTLLRLDYPAERRQVLVVSDASNDQTDQIVRGYEGRGVELVTLPTRRGKTAAESVASRYARGEIVVSTDATTQLEPDSIKPLVSVFQDPTVGVASGRDISAGALTSTSNRGESGYVGYEMWVRSLETRFGSIVGASGCFMAARRDLFSAGFPEELSRDFAAPLLARQAGYRSVSVEAARALVPRARSLQAEFRRKARTMARGLQTLWYLRSLLNPMRQGGFAWMLWSHKVARWLAFLALPLALASLVVLAPGRRLAQTALMAAAGLALGGAVAFAWPRKKPMPPLLAAAGYLTGSAVAALVAWARALLGERSAFWEPTRR